MTAGLGFLGGLIIAGIVVIAYMVPYKTVNKATRTGIAIL